MFTVLLQRRRSPSGSHYLRVRHRRILFFGELLAIMSLFHPSLRVLFRLLFVDAMLLASYCSVGSCALWHFCGSTILPGSLILKITILSLSAIQNSVNACPEALSMLVRVCPRLVDIIHRNVECFIFWDVQF